MAAARKEKEKPRTLALLNPDSWHADRVFGNCVVDVLMALWAFTFLLLMFLLFV